MEQGKKTYYVDLNSESILSEPIDSPSFVIHADEKEIEMLQAVLDDKYDADLETFVRAHIPYLEYHHDPGNDHYDGSQKVLYALIYLLGDKAAKQHIQEMGILEDRKTDDPEEIQRFR
ncbi:hypothetical protein [Domibacillus indicus]|uniref:hypothetical protein n=1 Tax=Domibacillus indicus TaxID=1437523 RepID=UPI0006182371|nr:hypothetical protein [Domibacillus indicus]